MTNSGHKAIHQVIVGASDGDAITSMALQIRAALRQEVESDIFARWVFSDSLQGDVKLLDQMPGSHACDLLLYHSSYGLPALTSLLLSRSEPLALSYHNLTPWQFYLDYNPEFALGLHWGHHELDLIRSRVILALADSSFNAADLIAHGYGDVKVVPVGVDPERLLTQPTDGALLRNLNESNPYGYVLAVAQILHHKRIEQLIEAVHLCNSVHDVDLGLVIAGVSRQPAYINGVLAHGKSLPNCRIRFLGAVTDRELATAFRGARLFLSMSDHEGFSIPPLEAMSFGIPVIAKGAGAVPETVGDGALVLPATASITLAAEAIFEVAFNEATRRQLILQGLQRVKNIRALDSAQAARTLLMDAIK